ncbi:MAG: septum formation protein Maf [Clostridia bacterium]|nr:septum formation protein Maf [Clostridia bacterium]
MKKVILASKSPRRIELFKRYGIIADSIPAEVDESIPAEICDPCEIVKYLAHKKARHIADSASDDVIVVGSDTLVFCGDKILGKPDNKDDARNMMKLLSDNTHSVISGICIICNDKCICESVRTEVVFKALTNEEIEGYISTFEPYDKAGGYGIQSLAGAFVKEIHGDYYNVVGLPISRLIEILKIDFGYDALSNLFNKGEV